MIRWKRTFFTLAAPALLSLGCGGGGENNGGTNNGTSGGGDGKGDFTQPLVCDVENSSRRDIDPTQLRDPVALHLLRGGDCPTTHLEMVEEFQRSHVKEDGSACDRAVETYLISEQAQGSGSADGANYRAVVTRECGETDRHELLWSVFGIRPAKADPGKNAEDWRIPETNIELIAFDDTSGVYNYYEMTGGGQFEYFGSSQDIVNKTAGRCQNCHNGGGLIMKELDTPWLHWEGHEAIPKSAELVDGNTAHFGFKGTGSTLESIVKRGNDQYNEKRIDWMLFETNTKEVLKPLFCTVEINLDNATDFKSTSFSRVPGDFFLDRRLAGFSSSVDIPEEAYNTVLGEVGSRVEGLPTLTDTIFKFTFPERAHIDDSYVSALIDRKIIDDQFATDVLMVDFTRPIFSDERCALLEFAPEIDFASAIQQAPGGVGQEAGTNNGTTGGTNNGAEGGLPPFADAIRQGFIDNLTAAAPAEGTAAAALLAHLQNAEDETTHKEARDAFITACKGRDKAEMVRDVVRVNSVYKRLSTDHANFSSVVETPQLTWTTENLNEPDTLRFNPTTCVAE